VLLPFNAGVMTPARIVTYGFAVVAIVVYAGVGGSSWPGSRATRSAGCCAC